jgi:hypothetical protein
MVLVSVDVASAPWRVVVLYVGDTIVFLDREYLQRVVGVIGVNIGVVPWTVVESIAIPFRLGDPGSGEILRPEP